MITALHLLEIVLLLVVIFRPLRVKMPDVIAPPTPVHQNKPEHLIRLVGRDDSLHGEVTTYADSCPSEWHLGGKSYKPSMWRVKDSGAWVFKETK